MDTSTPIPGFITRKQASDQCRRSERTLQRHWSTAIEARDASILERLKLRTEDGEVFEGGDVTKELIEQLKKQRRNPTWFVHATWVATTYGPRLDGDDDKREKDTSPAPSQPAIAMPVALGAHVNLLEQRIRDLERDKEQLANELKIKNDQISQANERSKETHVLMRDLHELLGDLQRRLPSPATLQAPVVESAPLSGPPASAPKAQPASIVTPERHPAEKGSHPGTKNRVQSTTKQTNRSRAARDTPRPKTNGPTPSRSVFEKHTPTLHRAWSRLFRRA